MPRIHRPIAACLPLASAIACFGLACAALPITAAERTAPAVLWVYKSPDHFVAAPMAGPGAVFVSGLAAFNTGNFYALSTDPAASERVLWSKSPPYLKLPTVSAPAVFGERVILGDGMHQTDGAALHCLATGDGRSLWQLAVPGDLVHLEGTPAVGEGRVFMGGGAAGVLAVDLARVTFQDREMPADEARAAGARLWKEALAKYEQEKIQDPTFAVPPSEDALPQPAPKVLWRQGDGMWHVDGSLALVGERLLVPSARLEKEQQGDRALLCLSATDGTTLWRTELKHNPWAGPVADDKQVVVATSSIRFDPKALKGAQGELVMLDLADGHVAWRKDVPGGVVASPVLRGDLVLFTASDGKLRAWERATGATRWTYDAKMPIFAGPAATADTVYMADLRGVVHAVGLDDGKPRWRFDLASDPAVKTTGMVYGTPLVDHGRLYVATCNLEGTTQRKPNAVVCLAID